MIYNNTQLYIIIKLKKETINKPIKKMFLWANKMDVNILKMLKRIIVLKIYKVSYDNNKEIMKMLLINNYEEIKDSLHCQWRYYR